MCSTRALRWLLASSTAVVLVALSYSAPSAAQSAATASSTSAVQATTVAQTAPSAASTTAAQDEAAKLRILQQRVDDMSKQLQQMQAEQAKTTKTVSAVDKGFNTFLKGFYGTLDGSIDVTTKGMDNLVAYPWGYGPGATNPPSPYGPFMIVGGPKVGPQGRVGWLGMMSSNGSNVGYRGTHQIGNSDWDFIYQVSTAINIAAAPGLQNTWTKQSNTVLGAIGLGDTYIGFQEHNLGKIKFGEMFLPYKTSTDRMNPFSGQLGDYSVIMGNTGGDNRVEFGTRMDHAIIFNSPNWSGVSFDLAYVLGQNPDANNNIVALGSVDCYGGNLPGSGNLPINCDDGGFNYGYGGDLKFEFGGLYAVVAYELHSGVNRSSDGVGSNHPYYGYLFGLGPGNAVPGGVANLSNQYLDWADYLALAGEFPGAAGAGSPEYLTSVDVANEWAMKAGFQYSFEFGLIISYIWEEMHREVPQIMEFQNERQRTGDWLALEWDFNGGRDRIAFGWAHAGASVGDPGGQHNFDPTQVGNNQANMYTIGFWHKFDKQLTWYFDAAETVNDTNAHYDMGAGGHGIKTDCHDATHATFIDYSSAGPTTWGGCHIIGFSTGVSFRF